MYKVYINLEGILYYVNVYSQLCIMLTWLFAIAMITIISLTQHDFVLHKCDHCYYILN